MIDVITTIALLIFGIVNAVRFRKEWIQTKCDLGKHDYREKTVLNLDDWSEQKVVACRHCKHLHPDRQPWWAGL